MIGSKQLKIGMIIKLDGDLWRVMSTSHTQPGKGGAYIQTKLRNIIKGNQTEHRFRSGENVERVVLDSRPATYLYKEGDAYHFMDQENYDQFQLGLDILDGITGFLKENTEVNIGSYDGKPLSVELPKTVKLKVIETEPYIKTATATNSFKGATLETGMSIQIPGFVEEGEEIEIDTESGEYLSRAK